MFEKIFGGTEEQQLQFLKWRSWLTIIIFFACGILTELGVDFIGLYGAIVLFVWGWGVVKNWFGFTSILALLSNNIMIGAILFVIYLVIAYFAGFLTSIIGIIRYFYLMAKLRNRK